MIERRAGSKAEAAFLRLFSVGNLAPVDVTIADYERMAELVELYADWPLGGTDASVIAIAERLRVTKVATLDRRHFGPIQPRHIEGFTLLPETLQ
jgi:predicted nucleic acid-binding protein